MARKNEKDSSKLVNKKKGSGDLIGRWIECVVLSRVFSDDFPSGATTGNPMAIRGKYHRIGLISNQPDQISQLL